ncbi:MAG: hypothetical protein LBF67_05825 [Prevotellaceae bacterium]|jgi:hypothetical protein|nr:hypothetical protein [Prevotellaceae bacterium]
MESEIHTRTMFGIFKKNPVTAIFVSLIVTLSLWGVNFSNPLQVRDNIPMMPLEQYFMELVELSPLLSTIAAFLLMYLLAGMLISLSGKHFFAPEQIYLPPFVFVLICSAFPMQKCMNGSYVAALCFMSGLFLLLRVYLNERVFVSIFLAAMFLSLASLFSASAVFLLLILPIALLLLRTPTQWRDWVIALCGALLPYLYAFVVFFLGKGNGFILFQQLYDCLFSSSNWIFENGGAVEWVYLSYLLLLVVQAVSMLMRGMLTSRIKVQKIYVLFVWTFFIMLAVMVKLPSGSMFLLPLMAIPAGVLIANFLTHTKYRRLAGFFFFMLIALTYVAQFYEMLAED